MTRSSPLVEFRIDPNRLEYELARRGLRIDSLAMLGFSPSTLQRIREGQKLGPQNLRKIQKLLKNTPLEAT